MAALLSVSYPALLYFGSDHFDPWVLALLLVPILLLRREWIPGPAWMAAALLAIVAAAILFGQYLPLKLYPALVSVGLLITFALSLRHPPTVIERFARLQEAHLSARAIRYARTVTWVWCGFFVFNGTISIATTLFASDAIWFLYNGVIAYLLIGAMFTGEWLCRRHHLQAGHG